MYSKKIDVLAVDDEELNLDIMKEYFEEAEFNSYEAHDGKEALEILDEGKHVDVIVLDRMMPNMNGMEFLEKVKSNPKYADIPIIMQTAASAPKQITEGIENGVFYYLTKPYSKDVFLSLIKAANDDCHKKAELRRKIAEYSRAMEMIEKGEFRFKTVEDAKILSVLIGSCLPDPEMMIVGLSELMINAVEHGNLGITYSEKSQLKKDGMWEAEVEKRQQTAENLQKFCTIEIMRDREEQEFMIKIVDQGNGFDWKKFSEFDSSRLLDPNGRGILMSQNCGFTNVLYNDKGNAVECKTKYNK